MTVDDPTTIGARNGHARCLLCGDLNPASLKLSFQPGSDGGVRATFKGDDVLQGYEGVLHGGVVAALLDAAMTHCLFHQGVQAVTGDLHIRYLAPASCGEALEIRARVVFSRPPLYRMQAELLGAGRPLAMADAKFMRRRAFQAPPKGEMHSHG